MEHVTLGLRENGKQFFLLVLINAFVGGMVGLERSILPEMAVSEFGMEVKTAILSFIAVFGITKAVTNYYTGVLAGRWGRKKLLVAGWLFGLPVPFLLMYAPDWSWVIFANVLLGINQGLTWSSTVVMKIDLVGEKNRGLAMGLNESAGYLAVGGVAFLTGWIASAYGLRPYPFYTGVVLAVAGLLGSWLLVKDTVHHVAKEAAASTVKKLKHVFWETTWKDRNLGSVTQAGLVNNLNDGMVWGLLPILLASRGFSIEDIGIIVAIYPAVWGLGQLVTGKMADHFSKKGMLFAGMFLQGIVLLLLLKAETFAHFVGLSAALGIGTAVVYPTFLASIAGFTHPSQRAQGIGVFRLWRDLGYPAGALLTGVIADAWGILPSVAATGGLTLLSSFLLLFRMRMPEGVADAGPCIEKEEVDRLRKAERVLILDVRSAEEYNKGHIEGALHMPLEAIGRKIAELRQADLIVTACTGGGGRSEQAARFLQRNGFNSRWLCGGTVGWMG